MPNTRDLNIGKNSHQYRNVDDALCEFYANAIDEHNRLEIDVNDIVVKYENNNVIIIDYGEGVESSDIKLEQNEMKRNNMSMNGQFGMGIIQALAISYSHEKKVKICTKKNIFTFDYNKTDVGDSLHIFRKRNQNHVNYGTKIIIYDIDTMIYNKFRNRFINLIDNKEILYNENNSLICILPSTQCIFVNGMKVFEDTEYHFSYNIVKNEKIMKALNCERKQIELTNFTKSIQDLLKRVTINNVMLEKIINIFQHNTYQLLAEFQYKDVIKHILNEINDMEKYVFIDIKDTSKLNKYNDLFELHNRIPFILGEGVRKKMCVSNIIDISIDNELVTLHSMLPPIQMNQDEIRRKINVLVTNIENELNITLDPIIRTNLSNITVDTTMEGDDMYDFSTSLLKISSMLSQNEDDLRYVIIFEYIINNISSSDKKKILKSLLRIQQNSSPSNSKSWLTPWSWFGR